MADGNVTVMLSKAAAGDKAALDSLLPLVYDELRRLAAVQMSHERTSHSLQATALVHEAYMKLVTQRDIDVTSRGLFFAIAANTMRRLLVDHARASGRLKRGGGADRVGLTGVLDVLSQSEEPNAEVDLLALDAAISELSAFSERAGRLVELRFFVGMSVDEAAKALDISPRQAALDWQTAKAFLAKKLHDAGRAD